jgi:tRNA nucleotidyltransferase/poly(A) polymerase
MASGDSRRIGKAFAALRGRPELRPLASITKRQGIGVWVVGGAVRDLALGLEVPEIDVAVTRDAERIAHALEQTGGGRAVFISRDRPGPRVYRVAGNRSLDVAEIEGGSIEADLARRDFTVNAVAVDLHTGRIVDPFGGLTDLASRRLRCVRQRNLSEDPLRALRAARFIATHGLRPDPAVLAASRRASPGLRNVASERIAAELSRLLGSVAAAPALGWAARARILPAALGLHLSDARARAVARGLCAADDRGVRRLPAARRRRLRLALLALRLRLKPADARRWLRERRWGRLEADEVARIMALSDAARKVRTRRDAWRWVLEAGSLAEDALLLLARRNARTPPTVRRLERLRKIRRRAVRVRGDDIVRWLDIPPGPAVGAWLAEIAVAAAMGEIRNRPEARNWLIGQVRNRLSAAIISAH